MLGWAIRPGQTLRRGAPLCFVEQDGRALDLPAPRGGVVRRLLARPPDTLVPGAPLAALAEAVPAGEHDLKLNGGTLRFRRWAAAGPERGRCVLLHGLGGSSDVWIGTAAALAADGFAVITLDLPAHGATTIPAETVHEIVALLGVAWGALEMPEPVHLVGHSMGGAVALLLAAATPQRIASLTLLAPLGFAPRLRAGYLSSLLAASDTTSLALALRPLTARPVPLSPKALAVTLAAQQRHAAALARLAGSLADGDRQRLDLAVTLAALPRPARLIVGDADAVLPWAGLVLPPHVPLHQLACGHMPHWEQPRVLRRLLAQRDWQPATGDRP